MPVETAIAVARAEYDRNGFTAELAAPWPAGPEVQACVVRDASGKVVSRGAGKGLDAQARASALYEGWEHYHLDRGMARLAGDAGGTRVLPPGELLSQPALRDEAMLHRLAADYPDARIGCLRLEPMEAGGAALWYPAFVKSPFYQLHPIPGDDLRYEPYLRYGSSTGTASGACDEEALLHALLEVVERDALSLAWLDWFVRGTGPVRVVDVARLPDDLRRLWRRVAAVVGSPPMLLEITTDLGIPAYCAVPAAAGRPGACGAGASLLPAYAVERALCELLQVVVTRPDDDPSRRRKASELRRWPLLARCYELDPSALRSLRRRSVRLADAEPSIGDLDRQLDRITRLLADRGHHAFRLRWNPEHQAISVMTVCVPGLENFSLLVGNGVPALPTGRGDRRMGAARAPAPAGR